MGLVALWLHVLQQSLPCSQGTYMLLFPFLNVYLQNLLCSTLFMFHLEPMQSELKKIETKTEILQASVDEFNVKPLVSREELEKVYEELKKGKVDDSAVSARDIVEKEIENHAAWSCRVDYALASGGGYVVGHSDPYLVRNEGNWFGTSRLLVYSKAVSMLTPSFGEPGNCFPLKGSNGYVQVRLRAPIIPEAVTLEHVSKVILTSHITLPQNDRFLYVNLSTLEEFSVKYFAIEIHVLQIGLLVTQSVID